MKPRHKMYIKLNLMSLFFVVLSLISGTLAWFAYSGLKNVTTEIDVLAWNISLTKDGKPSSNEIVINLSDLSPGMKPQTQTININNLGDSDALIKYSIKSARILDLKEDNHIVSETIKSDYVEDILSHEYPFSINFNLTKGYALTKGKGSELEVTISWPFLGGNDELDSIWGTKAYNFQKKEEELKIADPNYQKKASIALEISLTAEQYLESDISSDPNYNLGDTILFDVVQNKKCTVQNETCLKTIVIDRDNKSKNETVTLLPSLDGNYISSTFQDYLSNLTNITKTWIVPTRKLEVQDILNFISTDIKDANLVSPNLSNAIIGNLKYTGRMEKELNKAVTRNGYYDFSTTKYSFLNTPSCIWTNTSYNQTKAFAIINDLKDRSKLYGEEKTAMCKVIPIIEAKKINLK
ncbi:MAG: hypothetical protein RR623_03390 [Bacilli bacterium]